MNKSKKYAGIFCNEKFLYISTFSLVGGIEEDPLGEEFYFDLNVDIKTLGDAAVKALSKSRDLSMTEETRKQYSKICETNGVLEADGWLYQKFPEWQLFDNELCAERNELQLKKMLKDYKFKNKTAFYKNMQISYVDSSVENGLHFDSWQHLTTDGWGNPDGKTPSIEFTIPSASSLEVIGAAVKYAIGNCRGKGSDLIRSLLFPDGQPETFEKYIQGLGIE